MANVKTSEYMTIDGLRHQCDEWTDYDSSYVYVRTETQRVERSEARFMHQHAMNLCAIVTVIKIILTTRDWIRVII